ncbi:hypothetical protein A5766_20015 [Gordonia sp. 852002-51296_SCH5728562-b]|nr:hypothetical protein A5766_20015 [Gordonia sp. 852002-51296_SCH5728562-b]
MPEEKDRGSLHREEEPGEDRDSGAVVRDGREQRHLEHRERRAGEGEQSEQVGELAVVVADQYGQ